MLEKAPPPPLFLSLLILLTSLLALTPPSEAQIPPSATPTPTTLPDCPWPTGDDRITANATYTLTANCKVADTMSIRQNSTVTINGGGYSVDASALTRNKAIISSTAGTNLIVTNITFIGGGTTGAGALHLGGDATISNTTLRNVYRTAILGSFGTGGTYALSNILVENVTGVYINYANVGMAVEASNNGAFTINNMVARNALGGNAAVSIVPGEGGSVTMTGCLTADGVWPQAYFGAVDASEVTGACSGSSLPINGRQLNRLRVSHSTFRELRSSIHLLDHSATIENTVFEDNVTDDTRFFAASAIRFHFSSQVIIRDSVFRNNIGGPAPSTSTPPLLLATRPASISKAASLSRTTAPKIISMPAIT